MPGTGLGRASLATHPVLVRVGPKMDDREQWLRVCELVGMKAPGSLTRTEASLVLHLAGLRDEEALLVIEGVYENASTVALTTFSSALAGLDVDANPVTLVSLLEQLRKAFERVDTNESDEISTDELSRAFEGLGLGELSEIYTRFDNNGTGYINWIEFVRGATKVEQLSRHASIWKRVGALPSFVKGGKAVLQSKEVSSHMSLPEKIIVYGLQSVSQQGLKDSDGRSSCWRRCFGARNSYVSQMDTDGRCHVMSNSQRRRIHCIKNTAVLNSCLMGIIMSWLGIASGGLAIDMSGDNIYYQYLLLLVFGIVLTLVEMLFVYSTCLWAATSMTAVSGLELWPPDRQRQLIAGALARSALQLGHPTSVMLGIDPMKRVSKWKLYLVALVYAGKRVACKFVLKTALKKVAPRVMIKIVGSSLGVDMLDMILAMVVNTFWNFILMREVMKETLICCTGPSAVVGIVHDLIVTFERQALASGLKGGIRDRTSLLMMRAIGMVVTRKQLFHPNHRHMLQFLVTLFVTDDYIKRCVAAEDWFATTLGLEKKKPEEGEGDEDQIDNERLAQLHLDDDDAFESQLAELNGLETDLVLSVVVLACVADGSVSANERRVLQGALSACAPPRSGVYHGLHRIVMLFNGGHEVPVELFQAAVQDGGPPKLNWSDRCVYACVKILDIFGFC